MYRLIRFFIVLTQVTSLMCIACISDASGQASQNYLGCSINSANAESPMARAANALLPHDNSSIVTLPTSSGTNCQLAFYNYWIGPPDEQGLRYFKVTVSGITKDGKAASVVIQPKPNTFTGSSDPKYRQWEVDFILNTCAFQSASWVTIKVDVASWNGTIATGPALWRLKVINNALMVGNPAFYAPGGDPGSEQLNYPNIVTSAEAMGQHKQEAHEWSGRTVLLNIPMYTVFYSDSHCDWYDPYSTNDHNPYDHHNFDPALVDPNNDTDEADLIRPFEIGNWVNTKPKVDTPPYNFVDMIIDCYSLGNRWTNGTNIAFHYDDFALDFLNGNGPTTFYGIVDRAFIGCDDTMEDSSAGVYDQALWADLAKGMSLKQAMADLDKTTALPLGTNDNLITDPTAWLSEEPLVRGDLDMKLYGIYNIGLDKAPITQWWFAHDGPYTNL